MISHTSSSLLLSCYANQPLPEVQQLIGEGKTAQEIDDVVKVDDVPALEGLELLQK